METFDLNESLDIVIENPRNTYKSFEIEDDPIWKDYPLKGVTYPVDYGYINGYTSEDGQPLDVFVGKGDLYGLIRVWRYDVAIETKFVMNVTKEEWEEVIKAFEPVIREKQLFGTKKDFQEALSGYKK